ncbi:MAG: hypothetical protein GWN01_03730, partial [Nitrosopumilaceae archaeon]|nr:hypothetical protein [Nitrosopumilaceae archaeon]NIV65155.1 hypothetical protein [Nitrosopumilaceae archaeon]NIX60669.1 hypothetical protein [Nitrosopumilaceae archaeon]
MKINRKDTTLHSFAMVKKDILTFTTLKRGSMTNLVKTETEDELKVDETYHYIEYDYGDGFGYLS